MRRYALTLLASVSIVALAACNGYGGSAFGNSSSSAPTALGFATPGSGFNGNFKIAPSSTVPLLVSVFATKSNFALQQFDTSASWATTYAAPGSLYQDTSASLQPLMKPCPALPAGGFASPMLSALVVQGLSATGTGTTSFVPYTPGTQFQTIGIMPVAAQTVSAGPPAVVLNPPAAPYCLTVVATSPSGVQGSFNVFVGN